jgi:hypothetical protein
MINKELEKKVSDLKDSLINGDLISEIEDVYFPMRLLDPSENTVRSYGKDSFQSIYGGSFAPILSDDTEIREYNNRLIKCFICETDKAKDFYWSLEEFATASFWRQKKYYFCVICNNALDDKYGTKKWFNHQQHSTHGWAKYLLSPMTEDIENIDDFRETMLPLREKQIELMISAVYDKIERGKKDKQLLMDEEARQLKCKAQIVELLKEKNIKISVSDIDAFLKHQNVEEIKEFCEELYNDGEISFAGNGRYFVLTEGQEKPKKTSAPKSKEVDVEKELEKYKGLLDKGLITQEEYDAKRKQILGL